MGLHGNASFAGLRVVSTRTGKEGGADVTMIGSDDGVSFFYLNGRVNSTGVLIDFGGTLGEVTAEVRKRSLIWSQGSSQQWNKLGHEPNGVIQGCFTDANHWKTNDMSFIGTRFISNMNGRDENLGDEIVLLGSDDGETVWTLQGSFIDRATGELQIDFRPKGGPPDLKGTYRYRCRYRCRCRCRCRYRCRYRYWCRYGYY
jgi:hypothetical protein